MAEAHAEASTAEPTPAAPPAQQPPCSRTFVSCDEGVTFSVRWAGTSGYTDPLAVARLAAKAILSVLHEDEQLLVVDKPAFLPCENTVALKDSVRARMEQHVA
eukprot:6672660-Prymnesium_polylepis.1